jgi:hypothetical protein
MGPLDRRDGGILLALTAVGLGVSMWLGTPQLNSAQTSEKWVVGIAGLVVGVLSAWACLRLAKAAPELRWPGALWAVLPWYTCFLGQMAYIGFLLMVVEVAIGAACLSRRIRGSLGQAVWVLVVVRVAIFAVHQLLPAWLRGGSGIVGWMGVM